MDYVKNVNREEQRLLKENKKLIAIILGIFILLMPLVYSAYVNEALNHECSGSVCHVCLEVENVIRQLNHYGGTLAWTVFVILPIMAGLQRIIRKGYRYIAKETLITLKIELII